jgi:hypothetical protein
MGKKSKIDVDSSIKKEKRGKNQFTFLNARFDNFDKETVKRHIAFLILVSIATKLLVIFVTTSVFHSFIDYFDIGTYFNHAIPLLQGQLPYVNYQVEYPILIFVPIVLALIPAVLTHSPDAFVFAFQLLMVLCDILIVLCVYFIGLKIWREKTAMYAGLIYATAFSTAYFILTKYDAFPTLFLMIAVLFTVYKMNIRGYIFAALGFFAKIFPAIAFPFMIIYNAKDTSIKQEIFAVAKVVIPLFLLLFLPLYILRPETINTYLFATGRSVGVYANSVTFTLYTYLHEIGHFGITSDIVSVFMYTVMGIVLLLLVYFAFTDQKQEPKTFLKIVLCSIFSLVFFTKFHSPQYIVWFTPFLCLLVADDLIKIILFYVTQIFAYIEFPLMFRSYYVNLEYVHPLGSASWYLTLFFFTLEYLALLVLVYLIIRPPEGLLGKIKNKILRN